MTTIRSARVRLIWFDRFDQLLDGRCVRRDDTELPDLTRVSGYETALGRLGDRAHDRVMALPWAKRSTLSEATPSSRFWRYYLCLARGKEVTAREAHRRFVPLRYPTVTPDETSSEVPGVDLGFEVLVYAHGVAVIAALYLDDPEHPLTTSQVADRLGAARTAHWVTTWPGGRDGDARELLIDDIAQEIVDRTRSARCAGGEEPHEGIGRPFVVAAPIRGTTDRVFDGKAFDGEQFAASDAYPEIWSLAETDPGWRALRPPPFADAALESRRSDGVVLAHHRQRVIWFPDLVNDLLFDPRTGGRPRTSISCYSRNLTMLAVQIEALGSLVAWGLERRGQGLSNEQEWLVREAANRLAGLYGRDAPAAAALTSYLSRSGRRHIDDLGLVESVRTLYACVLEREPPTSFRP